MLTWLKKWWADDAAPPESLKIDPQHLLDSVCAKYGATYLRAILTEHHEVQITLVRPDATLSAVGATTADAVKSVAAKAHACWGAL